MDTSVVPVHNLRPQKRTYHSNRSRRDASQSVFYYGMCQNIPHQPRQCHKPTPWSEPSTSRINSQKHAVKPPPTNKYTYPVVNEKLKRDSSSESPVPDTDTDTDATELYLDSSEQEDIVTPKPNVTPKGKFVTKTFGVKSPAKSTDKAKSRKRKCPRCGYLADSSAQVNTHYKSLHEPVECEHCSLSFSTPSTLCRHLYTHRELKFKYNKCTNKFPFASDLRIHQVKHETRCSHKCSKCPKSFFMKGDLLRHTKIHDKKTWKCSMCEYTTLDEQNLKAHRRKHINLKPYMCLKCLQLFKYHTQWK